MRSVLKIGWRELVALPELGVTCLHAKIDTGARRSAIHAEKIQTFLKDGQKWVAFEVITDDNTGASAHCQMPILCRKRVMNSGGQQELRYFIRTRICLGEQTWLMDLSLTTRHQLRFSLLIGREALSRRVVIYPGRRYLQGEPSVHI